jgi:hypothetical protein
MNEEKARRILGESVSDDNSLVGHGDYIDWRVGQQENIIVLDGHFTPETLEAIAWWMRNISANVRDHRCLPEAGVTTKETNL